MLGRQRETAGNCDAPPLKNRIPGRVLVRGDIADLLLPNCFGAPCRRPLQVISGKSNTVRYFTDEFLDRCMAGRGGPGCLNSFSASMSGTSAGVRLPTGQAAG